MKLTLAAVAALSLATAAHAAPKVEAAWTRPAPQGQTGAGFMTLKNPDAKADTLVSIQSPLAGEVQIHQSSMAGGMASPETFDPKRYVPFEVGVRAEKILCAFPAIDTVVDDIKISKGLENIAKVLDRGTLIRSHKVADLGHILHSRHQYHWHTGYVPPQTVAAPHMGAVIARTLGPRNPAVPAFINIGQRLDLGEGEELKAFTTAGFLGSEYGPFNIPFPHEAASAVRPPAGMTPGRGRWSESIRTPGCRRARRRSTTRTWCRPYRARRAR